MSSRGQRTGPERADRGGRRSERWPMRDGDGKPRLTVTTRQNRQVVDITDDIELRLPAGEGVVTLWVAHTTAAIAAMDLDLVTDLDFLDFLARLVPDVAWWHPHDPAHAPDHLLASLIGPSVSVPLADGQLVLGSWQRIVLVELDGPRERSVVIH